MAYKSNYRLVEFWEEFSQGTLWKAYAKANPVESQTIAETVQKKIEEKPWHLPIDTANTHTGKGLVMVLLTLSGGRPATREET